ncbi:cell division protein ZipA C-terminal FtsZ-binding domain-containing protein [Candidatus Accumulibacter sp. ACC003]|uniref:cell division protein ZipA C-terminal FtsZ-binding domain-containing protein n=1 Tax=Candidatus Accumulibacter sp. ACC003 TaxID=2823334 RepID=UPI0025C07BF5|nr:cell division protein ZipA C-terminal FtsZ-binding domain-containing protein [Candidatus Accumulibacter sp. ACC003]
MTDLQMGLIGLGGAAVMGVLVYNKWQERKHRQLAEELLSARQTDVLLDEPRTGDGAADFAGGSGEERLEPLLRQDPDADVNEQAAAGHSSSAGQGVAAASAASAKSAEDGQPDHSPHAAAASPSGRAAAADLPDSRESPPPLCVLSPLIDYIAGIQCVEPAVAYRIHNAQRSALARLTKAVNWIGHNEDSGAWEPIVEDSDREYRHIRVGLQLVDRRGPVRDADLSIFKVAMQDLATALMGVAELPSRVPALQAAARLDEFCAGVDIQIGVNVISQGQVFAGTKLRALAESTGMIIDAAGRFARCDDAGHVLYVLVNQEANEFSAESMKTLSTHGVTFLLDVPRVGAGERVLTQMIEQARRLAEALGGALVDDNRRPLSEAAIEPIRRQVAQFQAVMTAHQVPAGSALAQRLFS